MKIESTRPYGASQLRRVGGKNSGTSKPRFVVGEGAEEAAAAVSAGASGAVGVTALGALLAVQEVGDSLSSRSKGVAWGNRLLDRLDDIRLALLTGGISHPALLRLQRELAAARERNLDPKLAGVLDEIELRARVELAKYGDGT